MRKILLFIALVLTLTVCPDAKQVHAEELAPELTLSNNGKKENLTDTSHYTACKFNEGDTITVTATDGSLIQGLYISWDSDPVPWILTTDNAELTCGSNAFLHEYVALETPSASLTIHIPQNSMRVDGIRIFSNNELPHDVQVWNPPCERADIMVVSSHSDDEILFFGGALTNYAYLYDAAVQVVYMTEFRSTGQDVREHEKLDGLWEAGIRFYPTCGNFYDKYAGNLNAAKKLYNYDETVEFLVGQIRRFQPQVLVTHDVDGEYGHGYHIFTCNALMDAVEYALDATQYPDSAALYGIWNTPKTYLHIFPYNKIKLDLHIPIEEDYAGRTALEILKAAYKKHVSQQQWSFRVADDYEHSCADFGLYRTLVGPDTTNDLLCNLKTYAVQEAEEVARLEAEAAALVAQKAEEERLAQEEQARLEAEEEMRQELADLKEQNNSLKEEQVALKDSSEKANASLRTELQIVSGQLASLQTVNKLLIGGVILSLLTIAGLLILLNKRKK